MPVYHHREKLLNAIIYFATKTKYFGKTKLYKLLYYLDFSHFKETGRSVTGLEYFTWAHGPAPRALHAELNNPKADFSEHIVLMKSEGKFVPIKAKKKFDAKYFSKRELRLLEQLALIFKDARAEDMEEASHLPKLPWDTTRNQKGMNETIDYLLALDDSAESLSVEEVRERERDRKKIEAAFR